MTIYDVYERTDTGIIKIAEINDQEITGDEASEIEEILKGQGWPAISPDRILSGIRVWATIRKDE